jgi:IclR family KDG regulon transcriptional repressor
MTKKPKVRLIQSLDRALNILDILADRDGAVGLTELANEMGLDSSTVYRLVATLRAHGYAQQDETDKRYALGPKAIELGQKALAKFTLRSRGAPFVRELASKTGETAHLVTIVGGQAVYVDKRIGSGPLTISAQIGGLALPYCTATGKAIAAHLTEAELDRLLSETELRRLTERTIVDPEVLREHLRTVRAQGYAVDNEEYHPGIRCVGAPIFDHRGFVVGALGISASVATLVEEKMERCTAVLLDVAGRLSESMGYVEGDE